MTSPTGFTRSPGFSATQQQIASIQSVDLTNLTAVGYTRQNTNVTIDFSYHVGAVHVVPAVGDQWIVKRFGTNWVLISQLPYEATSTEINTIKAAPARGTVQVGNTNPDGTGPLVLNGNQVIAAAPLKLYGVPTDAYPPVSPTDAGSIIYDSDQKEALITDGTTWAPIGGTGGGSTDLAWVDITGKPSTFPPTVPIDWSNIDNTPTDFPTDWASITGKPSTFPPTPPTGTPNGTKFWRDDDTWAVPPGSGGGGAGSINLVIGEDPTGTINGTNTVFTLANTYVSGTTMVYLNGIRTKRGTDYTETSGTTFTFTTAPSSGDVLQVDYIIPGDLLTFVAGETPSGTQNGTNVTFTLAHNYAHTTTSVFINGLRQQLGVGYTETGGANTITFTTAPLSTDIIAVDYLATS